MKIVFLNGGRLIPDGIKPSCLIQNGQEATNSALDQRDFGQSVRTAHVEFDGYFADVIVGFSHGGAAAVNLDLGSTPLVPLCPV